jgi:NAD(P)-dependent dehydrogenase (short-subunit alcohol dehydrogenase family)
VVRIFEHLSPENNIDRFEIGNSGLGQESVLQLAKHNPSKIYLASRSKENAQASINSIKIAVPDANIAILPLDLSSLASVRDAANVVNTTTDRLDILMNNAGIMATPPGTTKEGYEIQFGTNHVGHALLTRLLLPKLEATAEQPGSDVRIISLSSAGHQLAPKGGLLLDAVHSETGSIGTVARYGQSKLANILYSNELAKRYPKIRCISVHPGSVDTGLKRGIQSSYPWLSPIIPVLSVFFTNSVQQGALNQLWATTSKDAQSGKYYVPVGKENAGSAYAQDKELGEKLWKWTEGELDKFLAVK